jgi:hypothetical protein
MRPWNLALIGVALCVSATFLSNGRAQAAAAAPETVLNAAGKIGIVEEAQYVYGGYNYCWYPGGWHGPGWYVCSYGPWVRGRWWGGPAGWRGWAWRGGPGPYWRGGPRPYGYGGPYRHWH